MVAALAGRVASWGHYWAWRTIEGGSSKGGRLDLPGLLNPFVGFLNPLVGFLNPFVGFLSPFVGLLFTYENVINNLHASLISHILSRFAGWCAGSRSPSWLLLSSLRPGVLRQCSKEVC